MDQAEGDAAGRAEGEAAGRAEGRAEGQAAAQSPEQGALIDHAAALPMRRPTPPSPAGINPRMARAVACINRLF